MQLISYKASDARGWRNRFWFTRSLIALSIGVGVLCSPAVQADAPAESTKTKFVRYLADDEKGGKLETAAVTYKNGDGVAVTLIGAVHIGDPEYFAGLNESFDHYDALLYEMVKPKTAAPTAADVKAKRRSAGMIAWVSPLQQMMRTQLHLAFQLEAIQYDNRPNFVHADLDSDTFLQMQDDRNEGLLRLFIRAYRSEFERQKSGESTMGDAITPFQLLAALRAPDRPRQLKLLFARQFDELENKMGLFDGPNGSVIITERNKKAFEVLDAQMSIGKKNIGIYYGAGHFPDMEQRLMKMGFKKTGTTWRTAWDMSDSAAPATQPTHE